MKCNIIGAGRLGKNIALALSTSSIISSIAICNRTFESAQKACADLGFGLPISALETLPAADVTWISCNDDAIAEVVEQLTQRDRLKPGSFIIHSSGVLNSALLSPLKAKGCFIASFHPLKAFKTNYLDANAFKQVDCVLEGDEAVCDWLRSSFESLGAYVTAIKPENKPLYHAAACVASNYLITLASCSEELFLQAGLSTQQSRRMLLNLMQGNLTNLQQTETIAEALTGPLVRGDVKTISLHLDSIKNADILKLYKAAGLASIALTSLTEEQREQIKDLLVLSNTPP